MTYAIKHHARRFTKASLLLAGLVLASSVLAPAQQPDAGSDLDRSYLPIIKNDVGMIFRTLVSPDLVKTKLATPIFQMGAPEYVAQVMFDGTEFRSGGIFIINDKVGNSARFELIDTDATNRRPLYHPVTFSSGKKTQQPSTHSEITQSIAQAISAQAAAGNLQITVTVIPTTREILNKTPTTREIPNKKKVYYQEIHFKGIGLFSVSRLNTDAKQYVMVRQPDRYASNDERPQHRAVIKDLIIGVTEVTQKQWSKVMGYNPSHFKGDQLPVNNISYTEAVAFCAKLSDMEAEITLHRTYRLPTEAEWEYACRAGNTFPFSFSLLNEITNLDKHGWYRENADEQLHVVGTKKPNPWGLFDMYGNVSEWCQDIYDAEYYANPPPENDPTGPTTGSRRVLRGGNFMSPASSCRSSYRGQASPDLVSQLNGLRVVCVKTK